MTKLKKMGWSIMGLGLLLIIALPNFTILPTFLYDEKRIFECILLGFSSATFVWCYMRYKLAASSNLISMLFFLILVGVSMSSLLALLPAWSFLQLGWILLLCQLTLLVTFLYQQNYDRYIKYFTAALFVLATIYVGHILINTFSSFLNPYWPAWPNLAEYSIKMHGKEIIPQGFLGFSNVRFLNHLQTWSLPIMVFTICYFKDKLISGLRYLMFAITSGWWMLVFASDARGTMIASAISLIFVAYWYRKEAKNYIRTYLYTVSTGLAVYGLLFLVPANGGREILTRFTSSGRLELWKFTIDKITDHPISGIGPLHFSYFGLHAPEAHPHNILLQMAVEWGIPVTIFTLVLVITAYIKFIAKPQKNYSANSLLIKITLVASITAAIIHSMVSGIFITPLSQLMGALVLGWAIGHYFKCSNYLLFTKRKNLTLRNWLVIITIIGTTAFTLEKTYRDFLTIDIRNEQYLQEVNGKFTGKIPFYPRFWQQGRFGFEQIMQKEKTN